VLSVPKPASAALPNPAWCPVTGLDTNDVSGITQCFLNVMAAGSHGCATPLVPTLPERCVPASTHQDSDATESDPEPSFTRHNARQDIPLVHVRREDDASPPPAVTSVASSTGCPHCSALRSKLLAAGRCGVADIDSAQCSFCFKRRCQVGGGETTCCCASAS
jgi:hypothetical protein